MSGFQFESLKGYCVVGFDTDLREMPWGDVETKTTEVLEELKKAKASHVMIDLTSMEMIHSGLVAALVRMWKAIDGKDIRVVVVTPSELVAGVLKSAGLVKLFTIVDTREEAAYELGVSEGAQLEQRERRLVAWAGMPVALTAAAGLLPLFMHSDASVRANSELGAGLLAGVAVICGIISIIKDNGWRRGLAVLTILIAIAVLTTLYVRRNPQALRWKTWKKMFAVTTVIHQETPHRASDSWQPQPSLISFPEGYGT